ncbi:helix-turn-helix transcriptional regulator [Streptomyces xanthochromogenes]|nr:helix-turn-helix transcriptional regulator [Streptomyces xanthochromogenes]
MGKPVGVTARKLELGLRLRQLRSGCGLTIEEAIEGLYGQDEAVPVRQTLNPYILQRIERGRATFRYLQDLRGLAKLYGIENSAVEAELIELQKGAASQDWVTQYGNNLKPEMQTFVGVESTAQETRVYHPDLVPGILQTEGYARARFEQARPIEDTTMAFIDGHVQLRMRRKEESILRVEDPPRLEVILGEAALERRVGSVDIMRQQYAEIVRLSDLENVRIQVLPTKSWALQFAHNFTVLDLGDRLPPTVQVDSAWGAVSMSDKPSEVKRFMAYFTAMSASALPPEETPAIMQRLTREIEQ